MLLDGGYGEAPLRQFPRDSGADYSSSAYDSDVKHLSGKSVKMPSTAS